MSAAVDAIERGMVIRRVIATSEDGSAVIEVISDSGRRHVFQYKQRGQVRAQACNLRALAESLGIYGVPEHPTADPTEDPTL